MSESAALARCCDGHHTRRCNDILCCTTCPQVPVKQCWRNHAHHAHGWDSNHHLPGEYPARCPGLTEWQVIDSRHAAFDDLKRGRIW